jgi:hypothetical protein
VPSRQAQCGMEELKGESSKEKMFTVVRSPFTDKRSSKDKSRRLKTVFRAFSFFRVFVVFFCFSFYQL